MVFKIEYKSSVQKDLKRLSKYEAENILNQIETVLTQEANKFPLLKGEFKGLRKFRVGNYRVVFTLLSKMLQY